MQIGMDLTAHCPRRLWLPARERHHGLRSALYRWSPFVFPWSALQRMTGIVVSDVGVTLARGRLDGRHFSLDKAIHRYGADLAECLADLDHRQEGPACVCLPRHRTLVRHFRVPAQDEAEIEAMLPHLLVGELPQAIEHYSWLWSPLPAAEDGFTVIAVHVARNDQLESFLAPLLDAGLKIVNLVPESWCWARFIDLVDERGPVPTGPAPRSVVIRHDGASMIIVEQRGRLLFETVLPLAAFQSHRNGAGSVSLVWDGPGCEPARKAYRELLGAIMPEPQVWPEALLSTDLDEEPLHFAAAVALGGLDQLRVMMPPAALRRVRRRTIRDALPGLAGLAALALVVWFGLSLLEDGQTRRRLAELERQLLTERSRVEVLEQEWAVIRDNNRKQAGNTEILRALTSVSRHVQVPVYLEHLSYAEGRGVTMRGVAATHAGVLEMIEELAADPLWQGLRVMQLRTVKIEGADQVHFVVEGQLSR